MVLARSLLAPCGSCAVFGFARAISSGPSDLAALARSLGPLEMALAKPNTAQEPQGANNDLARTILNATARHNTFIASEDIPSDRKIMAAMTKMFYEDIDQAQLPQDFYQKIAQQYGPLHSEATYQKMADDIFANTMFLNSDKWQAFIQKPTAAALQADPAYAYMTAFVKNYNDKIDKRYKDFTILNND